MTRRGAPGVALALALAACPGSRTPPPPPLADNVGLSDGDQRSVAIAELQDEVLTSYVRDEPPDIDTGMLDPKVGPARIGVGPGDVLIAGELARAPSRWPFDLAAGTPAETRSKRLEINLARDGSAAWVSDEISWRIALCGRTAVIPLRFTALFARDGDRWVQVFEHLSFGRPPAPARDGKLRGATIKSEVTSTDLVDELSRVLAQLFRAGGRDRALVSTGPEAIAIGPDLPDEWRGPDILVSRIPALGLTGEDRRVGPVGRSLGTATVAYWVGNFTARLAARPGVAAGKARLRGTFVFEKRRLVRHVVDPGRPGLGAEPVPEREACKAGEADCRWVVVQAHVSQPIDDGPDPAGERRDVDLASLIFGTALISPKPLELTCGAD